MSNEGGNEGKSIARRCREAMGLTVADFAIHWGVGPQAVRRWEMSREKKQHRSPSREKLRGMIKVLQARGKE